MTTLTQLRSVGDSWTNSGHPDRNYGDNPGLKLDSTLKRAYLDFSLKALPVDAIVAQAVLRFYLRDDWAGTNTVTARRITGTWRETRITYNNAPTTSGTNTGTLAIVDGVAGDEAEIDVTDMVTQVLAGANFHGIRLDVDTADLRPLWSSDAVDRSLRPKLIVTYGVTPTPPTALNPHGGHACDASHPVLAWDVDTQSASWVQISTSTDFASPEYDDGDWVVNTDALYDLATTGYGGIPDDETRYWRVAIRDEDGNASDFSEPAQLERHTYGTLSIDSPTAGTVSTSSPTILTTFADRTLTRIDWMLQRQTSGGWVEVTKGTAPTDDFEVTGLTRSDDTYRVLVDAYDEFERASIPNETAFVRAVATFTYAAGSPDPVTSLALVQVTPDSPVIAATWQRDAAPDTFGVYCSGVLVDTVESGDAFVSGIDYAWDVYAAAGQVSNTIGVVATDAGEDSSMLTADITPAVSGRWVMAPDAGIALKIRGISPMNVVIGEDGETYKPLSGKPVRIVQSVQGLEGTISGPIVQAGDDSVAADDARIALLALKALGPGANIRIAFGRRNFAAILGQFGAEDWAGPQEAYDVTIPFWEVPE